MQFSLTQGSVDLVNEENEESPPIIRNDPNPMPVLIDGLASPDSVTNDPIVKYWRNIFVRYFPFFPMLESHHLSTKWLYKLEKATLYMKIFYMILQNINENINVNNMIHLK